jgi:hypothetical protein
MAKKSGFFGFLVATCQKLIIIIIIIIKTRFLFWVPACSQKCEGILNFLTFISCS